MRARFANLEAFLERARPYGGMQGIRKFVQDLAREWRDGVPHNEGRVDGGDAIEIITIHSAKGLEWPVVIPINTGTLLRRARHSSTAPTTKHCIG